MPTWCSCSAVHEPRSFHPKSAGRQMMLEFCSPLAERRLEHGIVDADVFALRVKAGKGGGELARAECSRDLLQHCGGFGQMLAQRVGQGARTPEKHSAIPEIVPCVHELGGASRIGLFREATHPQRIALKWRACLDVAVACLRARGTDPQHYDILSRSRRSRFHSSSTSRYRFSSPITWSEGNSPSTASGSLFISMNAARPMAGAVLRPTGSARTCCFLSRGTWRRISRSQMFVGDDPETARAEPAAADAKPSAESWFVFRRAPAIVWRDGCRLSGQKRVPRPPARITGWKLVLAISEAIEDFRF